MLSPMLLIALFTILPIPSTSQSATSTSTTTPEFINYDKPLCVGYCSRGKDLWCKDPFKTHPSREVCRDNDWLPTKPTTKGPCPFCQPRICLFECLEPNMDLYCLLEPGNYTDPTGIFVVEYPEKELCLPAGTVETSTLLRQRCVICRDPPICRGECKNDKKELWCKEAYERMPKREICRDLDWEIGESTEEGVYNKGPCDICED